MTGKYLGFRIAQRLSTYLSRSSSFRVAEWLADCQWLRAHAEREAVRTNLSFVLSRPIAADDPLIREAFRNFGRYVVEFFAIHRIADPLVTVEGLEELRDALERAGRAIILTGHLGNWELGAVFLRRMGFPMTAVALPHDDPKMDRLFNSQRRRCGLAVIPLGQQSVRAGLRSLRRGELLGLLGDRDFTGNGVMVSLSGQEVRFPRGPAVLSLRSHAPVIPTFCVREGPWKFRLCFEQPLWPQTQLPHEPAIHLLTQAYATRLAHYLKRYPDQWLLFQPIVTPQGSDGRKGSPHVLVPQSQ